MTQYSFKYQNYLEFIRSICLLNFNTEWDAMRIPSTKRICFVGQFDSNSNLDKIDALLKEKEKFKPRDIKGFGLIPVKYLLLLIQRKNRI